MVELAKLELWFFRDLSDDQRLKLFSVFGMPVDEIGKVHGHQRKALRWIITRTPEPSQAEAPAPDVRAIVEQAKRLADAAENFAVRFNMNEMPEDADRQRQAVLDQVSLLRSALSPAPSQEAGGEPVAWLVERRGEDHKELRFEPPADLPFNHRNWSWAPLYTHPSASAPTEAMVEALRPFLSFAEHSVERYDDGWIWKNSGQERICDWFGPSDFGLLANFFAALTAGRQA